MNASGIEPEITAPNEDPIHLTILHTNDMHAHLEPMARLTTLARRLRAEAQAQGHPVLLWDAGDAADQRPRICSISKGEVFASILNAMEYDLQVMGNALSITYGPQALGPLAARAGFPILAANCRDGKSPLPTGLQESVLVPLPYGRPMGVLGLTTPLGGVYTIFGLHFPDPHTLARNLTARLKAAGAAPIVVLSHLGLEEDRHLAEAVPEIDLIVGGHSHDLLPAGETCNGVLIAQAGEHAAALGRIDLILNAHTGQIVSKSAQVLEVPKEEMPDPAVLAAIAAAEEETEALMARPVGQLAAPFDLDHFAECDVGNFAADVLRQRMEADVGMICSGQFHTGLPEGTLTLGQLDSACFSTANPCLTEVQGVQIVAALERGLDPVISEGTFGGLRGTPFGIPQISGLIVDFDPHAEGGHKIRRVLVQREDGDRPLDPQDTYRLAHTDAESIADYGFLVLDDEQETLHEVPTIVREAMEDYMQEHSPVPRPERGRWRPVIPSATET